VGATPDRTRSDESETSPRRGGARQALADREFRFLLGAVAVSQTGDWLYLTALVVFVFDATHSVAWVGAIVVARQIASMSCSAIGGVLVDRFDHRRWMIAINLAEAFVLTAMALVAALHGPTVLMIGLAFCTAALAAAYRPAVFAVMPDVVSEDGLAAANALVSTIEQVALAAGPALGGLVVAFAPSWSAFAIDGATFLVAAIWVRGIRRASRAENERGAEAAIERVSMRDRLVAGAQAIRISPAAAVVVAMIVGSLAVYGFEQVLYVAVSARRLGTGSAGVGALSAAYGVGGLLAALVAGRVAGRGRPATILVGTFAATGLALASLAWIASAAVAYAVLFLGGGAFVTFEVVAITVLQRSVDPTLMGRVFGILMTIGSAATLLASIAAPAIADSVGLRAALVAGGAIPFVVLAAIAPKLVQLDRITTSAGTTDTPTIIDFTRDEDAIDEAPPHAEPRAGSTLSSTRE